MHIRYQTCILLLSLISLIPLACGAWFATQPGVYKCAITETYSIMCIGMRLEQQHFVTIDGVDNVAYSSCVSSNCITCDVKLVEVCTEHDHVLIVGTGYLGNRGRILLGIGSLCLIMQVAVAGLSVYSINAELRSY